MSKVRPFYLPYYTVKNLSSPEDLSNNRKTYVGQTLIKSVIDIPDDENVRD